MAGLALAFAAALLSLAGIPLTVGFIGLYYYLRIIVAMAAAAVADPDSRVPSEHRTRREPLGHAVLAALVLLLIGLGAYPAPLLSLVRATASMVTH